MSGALTKRVRINFKSGVLSAGVDDEATSNQLESSEFAGLPTVVAPDYLRLTLDPEDSAPEIVTVTAHAASSTAVTVVRGAEGTTRKAHTVGTEWRLAFTAADLDDIEAAVPAGFSPLGHTHDSRYFTESEADARFLGIAAKAADANLLDGLNSSAFSLSTHTHDDRYYTESEANARYLPIAGTAAAATKLATARTITVSLSGGGLSGAGSTTFDGTANKTIAVAMSAHSHNDLYYTEAEVNSLLAGKAASSHTHDAGEIASGTILVARLPVATEAARGIVLLASGRVQSNTDRVSTQEVTNSKLAAHTGYGSQVRVSTSSPTGGQNGDLWLQV